MVVLYQRNLQGKTRLHHGCEISRYLTPALSRASLTARTSDGCNFPSFGILTSFSFPLSSWIILVGEPYGPRIMPFSLVSSLISRQRGINSSSQESSECKLS